MSHEDDDLRERIRVRAYCLWVSEGCPSALEQEYWLRAESHERGQPQPRQEAPPPPETSKAGLHEGVVEQESLAGSAPAELPARTNVSPKTGSPNSPPMKVSTQTELRAQIAICAVFMRDFRSGLAPFRLGKGMTAAIKTDEDGVEYLALADGAVNAQSGGATDGYSVRVPDELERAASGNRIIVRAVARATGGGHAKVALAYRPTKWAIRGGDGWLLAQSGRQSPLNTPYLPWSGEMATCRGSGRTERKARGRHLLRFGRVRSEARPSLTAYACARPPSRAGGHDPTAGSAALARRRAACHHGRHKKRDSPCPCSIPSPRCSRPSSC